MSTRHTQIEPDNWKPFPDPDPPLIKCQHGTFIPMAKGPLCYQARRRQWGWEINLSNLHVRSTHQKPTQ